MRKALILKALVLVLLGTTGVAAARPPLKTPEEVLRHIAHHRGDAALVTYTAAPDGTPDPADPVLFHNADEPMPLASTIKIVVLAAYAREVVAGRLDPDEGISLGDWDRFYLPGTDGGAHPRALADLNVPADEHGFVLNPAASVPLDKVVRAMIRRSDNAATDLLMARLGRDTLRATIAEARLGGQETPLPFLGLFLSWTNHEEGSLTPRRVQQLKGLSNTRYTARVDRFTAAYQDEDWRQEERRRRIEGRYRFRYPLEEQTAGMLFPAGTARDYARIMAGVVTGTFLSPEISAVMRPHLERDLLGSTDFESIGFKGGSLAGVLTEAIWFVPREGDFAGKPRIVVLFQRWLHPFDWAPLVRFNGQAVFGIRLALDRGFAEQTRTALTPRR
jgi:D-alanyl-D-alanine carboxypeptidase